MQTDNILLHTFNPVKKIWLNERIVQVLWAIWAVSRLGHLISIYDSPVSKILTIDAAYYHNLAIQFAEKGWGDTIWFMNPGYPTFVGILYWLFDTSPFMVMVFQTILEGVALWLFLKCARILLTESAVRVAMLLWIGYAVIPYFNGTLLTSTLILTMTIVSIYFFLRGNLENKISMFLFSGLAVGATILCRPIPLLLLPLILLYFLGNKTIELRWKKLLFFLTGVLIIILPITTRNYVLTDNFIISQNSSGVVFWIGNNENANGLYYEAPFLTSAEPEKEETDFRAKASELTKKKLSSAEASQFWFKEALRWIVKNPMNAIQLQWKKVLYWGNRTEAPNNISYYVVKEMSPFVNYLPFGWSILMIFSFVGLWSIWRFRKLWIFPLLILGTYFLANQVFYSASEYRVAVVPVLILLTASAIQFLWRLLINNKNNRFMVGIMLLTPGFLWSQYNNTDFINLRNTKMDYFNWAQTAYRMGLTFDAIQHYHHALAKDPFFWEGHYQLAMTLYELGFEEQARDEFARIGLSGPELLPESVGSLPQDSTGKLDKFQLEKLYLKILQETSGQKRVPLLLGLGSVYQESNRYEMAKSVFQEALSFDSTKAEIFLRLAQLDNATHNYEDALRNVDITLDLQADNVLANLTKYHILKKLDRVKEADEHLFYMEKVSKSDYQWQYLVKEKLKSNLGFEPGPELQQLLPDTTHHPSGNW